MAIEGLVIQKIGYAVKFDQTKYSRATGSAVGFEGREYTLIAFMFVQSRPTGGYMLNYNPPSGGFGLYKATATQLGYLSNTSLHTWRTIKWFSNPRDKWYVFTMKYSYKEELVRVYVDGSLYTSFGDSGTFVEDKSLVLGWDTTGVVDRYATFDLAAMLFYNRALSDSEIKYISYNPNKPITKDLVIWLDARTFDEGAGKWYDLSGKGNHFTVANCERVMLKKAEVTVK